MMKKIIISLFSLCMILITSCCYAAGFSEEVQFLRTLGIQIPEGETLITREEMAVILTELLDMESYLTSGNVMNYSDIAGCSEGSAAAINTVSMMGLMSGSDGRFAPQDYITVEQAAKTLVCALGRGTIANANGGYPAGYLAEAAKTGILTDSNAHDKFVTGALLNQMVYRTLVSEDYLKTNGFEGDNVVTFTGKTSILNDVFKVFEDNGIVTATDITGLADDSGLRTGEVRIGTTVYKNAPNGSDLLGRYVHYFYREDSDSDYDTLLFMEAPENRNDVINICEDDIVSFKQGTYTYYDQDNKKCTMDVSPTAYVLLNGVYTTGEITEYVPEFGEVTGIDNNKDGYMDVLFIDSYETGIVDGLSLENNVISFKNSTEALWMDKFDDGYTLTNKDGYYFEITDLKEWDVLHIGKSKNGKFCKMIVVFGPIQGEITSVSDDFLEMDEERYEMADGAGFVDTALPEVGIEAYVLRNYRGKVASVFKKADSTIRYALLRKTGSKSGIESTRLFRVFDEDGQHKEFELDNNCTLNGKKVSNAVFQATFAKVNSGTEQMIAYRLKNNKICDVYTASPMEDAGPDAVEDGLRLQGRGSLAFRKILASFEGKIVINGDTKIFNIPPDGREEMYMVNGWNNLWNGTTYNVEGYCFERDAVVSDVILIRLKEGQGRDAYINENSAVVLIESISEVYNTENQRAHKLVGYQNGSKISLVTSELKVANDLELEPGDVIRYTLNNMGNVEIMTKEFDYSEKALTWANNPSSSFGSGSRFFYASVYDRKDNVFRITAKDPSDIQRSDLELMDAGKFRIMIFDESTKKVRYGTADDFITYKADKTGYSKCFMHMIYGEPQVLILYKNH